MSCAEHAIENAIMATKNNRSFEDWKNNDTNLLYINATPEEVWQMAYYALYGM